MNVFSGLREQVLNDVKARFDEMAARMDLVPREDFDRLQTQVAELQKRLDALQGKAKGTAAKKPAPKVATKTAAKKKTGKKKA